jgi:hypothetical protein
MFALAVTGALAAGCGSGGSASASSASLGAGSPFTKAQGAAYADAVNMRAADVPGFQTARYQPKHETTAGPYRGGMNRCEEAAAAPRDVIGISSPTFIHIGSLPLRSVSSGVYYFKSEALAHQYLAAAYSTRFAACLKTVASQQPTVTCEGSKVAEPMSSDPRLSALPASLPGVRTSGLRLAVQSACGPPGRSDSFEDFLSFVKGNAVITLSDVGEPHPFPAAAERRILARLYRRAQAHSL